MSNTKLIFFGCSNDDRDHELQVYANANDAIFIEIEIPGIPPSYITLDKHTAIKLSKVLKSEISKLNNE